jgi:ribosome maturation factor RimP
MSDPTPPDVRAHPPTDSRFRGEIGDENAIVLEDANRRPRRRARGWWKILLAVVGVLVVVVLVAGFWVYRKLDPPGSPGEAVTVDDRARASRALEARLDGGQLVSAEYVLQVSSPGERPLRSTLDWQRFIGRWANVLTPEHGGRIEGKILAVEGENGSEVAVLEPKPGDQRRIPLAAVKEARLAFHL